MKRLIVAFFALAVLLIPASSVFAISGYPTITFEQVHHTRNNTNEVVRIKTDQPTYFEMLYCEGNSIPSSPTSADCTWLMDDEWQTGYHKRNAIRMTGLTPKTEYTYRIQLVSESGRAVVTENTFYNH
ncbi:hypothetical protein HON52_01100 [Candidatus Uhrbacteria bacterium]|jgi:hypothetical protein|nr:hypothetical protein [Candidatus Uhrbacteria bacterium]